MKKLFFLSAVLLFLPMSVFAYTVKNDDVVTISRDEVIEGSLFVSSSILDIDGVVNGDVFCISPKLEISGTVNGDIICIGENASISGTTTGDIRIAFGTAKIDGVIMGNTSVLTDYIEVQDTAMLGGEFLLLSNKAQLAGEVASDLYGAVNSANISSFVGGDVSLRQVNGFLSDKELGEFKLLSGATIEGDFNFKSSRDYKKEEGVIIGGEERKTIKVDEKEDYSGDIFWSLVVIFSNILIALVLISLFKNFVNSVSGIIKTQSIKSLWLGLLVFLLFPISFILLLLTMIGIPFAVLLLFIFLGIILISKSIVSIVLGEKILELLKSKNKDSLNLSAVVGAVALFIVVSIPLIGSFISFLTMVLVLGVVLQYFRASLNK